MQRLGKKMIWELALLVAILWLGPPGWAQGPPSVTVGTDLSGEFHSFEELESWLRGWALENQADPAEVEEQLGALRSTAEVGPAAACKTISVTPASITAQKPFFVKFYQILIKVQIGDCGNVLCSTMSFDLTWNPGPSTGAFILGPYPGQTREQVCQGSSVVSKGLLLLFSSVPPGGYRLAVKVGGFGTADYSSISVTVK